jgi:hypothetical protein
MGLARPSVCARRSTRPSVNSGRKPRLRKGRALKSRPDIAVRIEVINQNDIPTAAGDAGAFGHHRVRPSDELRD